MTLPNSSKARSLRSGVRRAGHVRAGVEVALARSWSAKGEYLFVKSRRRVMHY